MRWVAESDCVTRTPQKLKSATDSRFAPTAPASAPLPATSAAAAAAFSRH
eukprot:CAMPEP_0172195784 /NCGR_PEP_ID=MMETSP1050-20130122/26416_1 /TAXON_ID=233186 /ORGANISM="Cryptomonas curvata, Strain CCAP979/52" /LENGTH=49 /DNA_ID= /DNA_START= /DNA_END= /DNA_ORIENTATION=